MVDAYGAVTWWGFSPCLNMEREVSGVSALSVAAEGSCSMVNILLVGAGDCRHILKTICQAWKRPKRNYTFYVIENNLEVLARTMLFFHLILEGPNEMGLQGKTEMFLEIFGNLLVREQTRDYIASRATNCIKMVTDLDYLNEKFPLFDLSALKFKERDHLEAVFKFWRNPDKMSFDASKFWDNRLRAYLQARYDSRAGAFDWDYNMKLVERDADIIHKTEYSRWRNTGVAFELREASYIIPNKTLASGLIFNSGGEKVARRGYWGDIICSPFLAFGIESQNQDLFKKSNGMHTKTAADVSEFNILSCLHELIRHESYKPAEQVVNSSNIKEAQLTEITEEDEEENDKDGNEREDELLKLENVKIVFLSKDMASEIHKKKKYHSLFDVVYFSNSMVHNFTPEMSQVFKDRASVCCETAKFMLDLGKEQCQQFVTKVTEIARKAGCQTSGPCDGCKDSFMKFSFDRIRAE
ncbi:Dynein assembly factor 3, axonemal [Holothuria leucospilota]|uniref:Dynein assembly factor 3, axonemal n=1 Tax=Holothuria leucospilota TaxID=206669 RepID=A0A9Q0YQC4_HOLLE|nr:Dynein assembly factor 3, axonemal [Holothuria leucospilota]